MSRKVFAVVLSVSALAFGGLNSIAQDGAEPAICQDGLRASSVDHGGPGGFGAGKVDIVFQVIEGVGEIVGMVFDIISMFQPDTAQMELNSRLDQMSDKLDTMQNKLNEMSQQLTDLAASFKLKTDEIMNQTTQSNIVSSSNEINSLFTHLKDKIKVLRQTPTKDAAFWDGFKAQITATCTETRVIDMKQYMGKLSSHMIGDASYTGGLDAYTTTIMNRFTVPASGESWPSKTAEDGYDLLASYYGEKVILMYNGLSFIQAYYYGNDSGKGEKRAEFLQYYNSTFKLAMDRMSAKFLSCVNQITSRQANLRSVNSADHMALFKEISNLDGKVVYSQAIVEGITRKADFLAAICADLKTQGTTTVKDDKGNTKQIAELVNRKKLGLFLRFFSEPSMAPYHAAASSKTGSSADMEIKPGSYYNNLIPAANHLDWQWGLTNGDKRYWKKADKLSFALFRHMSEDMAEGNCNLSMSHSVTLPGLQKTTKHTYGSYSLADYDLNTGEPADSSTKAENIVKMCYFYAYDTARGYRSSPWSASWSTQKTYVTWDNNANGKGVPEFLDPTQSPSTYSVDTDTGRINAYIAGRKTGLHSYYGYNRYSLTPSTQRLWANAGDATARLSVKDKYYLQQEISRMSGNLWVACELKNGAITGNPGDYSLDWGLSSRDSGAAPFQKFVPTEQSETRYFDIWPRMLVQPGREASYTLLLYEALSHKWFWHWDAYKNHLTSNFGSSTGAYEIFIETQESPNVWVASSTTSAGGRFKAGDSVAQPPDFALITMAVGSKNPGLLMLEGTNGEFTSLAIGDFNGDMVDDCLVLGSDKTSISYLSINIDEDSFADTQSSYDNRKSAKKSRVKSISPLIGTIYNLQEGESFVAAGDFNGDGTSDLLIGEADGSLSLLYINCGSITSREPLSGVPAGSVLGRGDFNGDGIEDLLFRDSSSDIPTFTILFRGRSDMAPYVIPAESIPGADSSLFAVTDCNDDGVDDLVWSDNFTGIAYITCFSDDGEVSADGPLPMKAKLWEKGWRLFAVADLNFDGCADYVWSLKKDGENKFYVNFMRGFDAAPSSRLWQSGQLKLPKNGLLPANPHAVEFD